MGFRILITSLIVIAITSVIIKNIDFDDLPIAISGIIIVSWFGALVTSILTILYLVWTA